VRRQSVVLLLLSVLVAACVPLSADDLASVREHGVLRWAGDQEGGGPYVYPRTDNPNAVTGFEVELANSLAAHLHSKAQFVQGDWAELPEILQTRRTDIILNGYERTPQRLVTMSASIPYYIYGLQLLAKKGSATLANWADLKTTKAHRPLKVGVLTGSAAEVYVRAFCEHGSAKPTCEAVGYDGNTDAMREVETGKLDGALEDTPIATFYAPRFPSLAFIGKPVSEGYYVIYARKGQTALIQEINASLISMVRDGELERIYRKYGIWNEQQQTLNAIAGSAKFYGYPETAETSERINTGTPELVTTAVRERGWNVVRNYGGVLLESAGMTVILSVVSFPIAIAIGMFVAIGRLYGPQWLRLPLGAYVEFLRGTPLMLQLYFIFFFLPEVGIAIPAFWTGILGLAINYSAYESEIHRAGLQAIPNGQMEAAISLGMSRWLAIRRIIAPQAIRLVIPPIVSDFIALYKDTSVCSVITIVELTKRFSVLSMSTQATVELLLMTGLLYLLMSYPVAVLSRRLEHSRAMA
jgi:polar amino acid transport system substrate-binding protein